MDPAASGPGQGRSIPRKPVGQVESQSVAQPQITTDKPIAEDSNATPKQNPKAISHGLDRLLPPYRRYMGLSRRNFLIAVALFIVALLALIIGLAVGLTTGHSRCVEQSDCFQVYGALPSNVIHLVRKTSLYPAIPRISPAILRITAWVLERVASHIRTMMRLYQSVILSSMLSKVGAIRIRIHCVEE
jgi:hypothetical protein